MPCYSSGVAQATASLRQRFQLHLSADEAEQFVETDLIAKSFGSYYTRLYVFLETRFRPPLFETVTDNLDMIHSNTGLRAFIRWDSIRFGIGMR